MILHNMYSSLIVALFCSWSPIVALSPQDHFKEGGSDNQQALYDRVLSQIGENLDFVENDEQMIILKEDRLDHVTSLMGKNFRTLEAIQGSISQIGDEVIGSGPNDLFGISTALSYNGKYFVVGAPGKGLTGAFDGKGYTKVYMRSNTFPPQWTQVGSTIFGKANKDRSGNEVAISRDGTIIAIGATRNDAGTLNSGQVRIFELNATQEWEQLGDAIQGEKENDRSGRAIALSDDGKYIAIGTDGYDGASEQDDIGHVRVFKWNESEWVQEGKDIVGEAAEDASGYSVAMSGDGTIVVIGANQNDPDHNNNNAGHVRVYKRNADTNALGWTQVGGDLDGEFAADESGISVATSQDGNTVVIGAIKNDDTSSNAGHVRVYVRNETNTDEPVGWTMLGGDIDGESKGDKSGITVSTTSDGRTVVIGARNNDGNGKNAGHARIFSYDLCKDKWVQIGLDIDGEAAGDHAGFDSHISGDGKTVVVGARYNDSNGTDSGHVRIFHLGSLTVMPFGESGGDPHFKTYNNNYFSFHGECDLVLMESAEFLYGLGLAIHIRTTRIENFHVAYSYISGAALSIGSDVFEVLPDGNLVVNGDYLPHDVSTRDEMVLSDSFPSFLSVRKEMMGKQKKIIQYNLSFVNMSNNIHIRSNTKTKMIFVDVEGHFPNSVGLLGSSAGDKKGLLARDGVTDFTGEWNTFGEEWQVKDVDQKLFIENREPQYPKGCRYSAQKSSHLRQSRRRLLMENDTDNKMTVALATSVCAESPEGRKKDFCIADVMATGDKDLADDRFYN